MGYDWDLMERLLQRARDCAGVNFTPRAYAEELAREKEEREGRIPGDMDDMRLRAADYEALLLEGGFIEPRPQALGGTGENFMPTQRGVRLLEMLQQPNGRALLDEQGNNALTPEVFDGLSGTRPVASSGLG